MFFVRLGLRTYMTVISPYIRHIFAVFYYLLPVRNADCTLSCQVMIVNRIFTGYLLCAARFYRATKDDECFH